jgi:histidyl-tRNA synthetase
VISAIRGTHDILPGEVEKWQLVERLSRQLCARYGYVEIRTPILEHEELFAKGTGESTDIVQKEMYSFTDKGGERVTLRPEATPSIVRAFIEHNLEQILPAAKLFSLGPMFRYERPQKGRYRQFHQLDVEVFGVTDPAIDAEVIDLAWNLVTELKIEDAALVINSVGCGCRPVPGGAARGLGDDLPKLCRTASAGPTNPLRIYDCKVPADSRSSNGCRHAIDYLDEAVRQHPLPPVAASHVRASRGGFHRLVRGLDYYTRTTFAVLERRSGPNALLGGGRSDGLVRISAARIGRDRQFAAGLERLVMALPEGVGHAAPRAFVCAATADRATRRCGSCGAARGLRATSRFEAAA